MTGEPPAAHRSLAESLGAHGFVVTPPDVAPEERAWPAEVSESGAWLPGAPGAAADDPEAFALDDSDAPILDEALAERTYVRQGPDGATGAAGPGASGVGLQAAASRVPRAPSTLADGRPPTPPPDLRERLRARTLPPR
jgi:hypothetical protein